MAELEEDEVVGGLDPWWRWAKWARAEALKNGDPTPDGWMLLMLILPSLIFDSSSLNLGCLSLMDSVFLSSSVASRLEMLKLDRFDAAGVVVVVADGGGT